MVRRREELRVLMIAPTSFFSDYGCHVRIFEEARGLQSRGHQVTICTYHNGNSVPGLTIRRSLGPPGPKRTVVGSSRHKLYLDAALTARTLGTALAFRPDIIHAHLHEGALIGGALAQLLRRPLLFDYQGSLTAEMVDHNFLNPAGMLFRPTRLLESIANRTASAIVTSTRNAATLLQRDFGLGAPQVSTVADGVDTGRFRPRLLATDERAALRAKYGINPEHKVVVYLGLLAPHQGTGLLLEAAKIVVAKEPRAFFLIGGFPGNETYRQQATTLGLDPYTSFPGRIPYDQAEQFLALGDVAISPKRSMTEGNGKLYNYAAMGLPTIAFDLPANREILGDLAAYPAAQTPEALADTILEMIANPSEAHWRGQALRERAIQHLSWPARLNELLEVYERLQGLPRATLTQPIPAYAASKPHSADGDD